MKHVITCICTVFKDMGFDKGVLTTAPKKVRRPDPGATLANIYLGEMSENRGKISFVMGKYPVKYDEQGRVVDPGTGFLYEIGDHVYVSCCCLL